MKKLRYFCEAALVRFAAWLLPRLPRPVIIALADGIGDLACLIDARGRRTARQNLRAAFKGALGEREVRRITRGSYRTFARTFLDLFWSSKLTAQNWPQFVRITYADEDVEAQARQTGSLWVTPHFGNFELASLFWGFRNFHFKVVAQDFKNPPLTKIFRRLREHSGHTVISQQGAMLRLMKALKRQGHAAMLTDLTVSPGRSATVIQCFGLKTSVTALHVQLAQRLKLSIIPGLCVPLPDGTYEVRIFGAIQSRPDEPVAACAQQVWDHFEGVIRQHPECWMWMYKHWRYLPGVEQDPAYPPYAKRSPKFRALMQTAEAES